MKKLCFLTALMICLTITVQTTNGQNIIYEHDEAGNRILRTFENELKSAELNADTILIAETEKEECSEEEQLPDKSGPFRVNIYPNSTNGEFTLELPDINPDDQGYISIFDTTGQRRLYHPTVQYSQKMDISSFRIGVYIVYVTIGGKTVVSKVIRSEL